MNNSVRLLLGAGVLAAGAIAVADDGDRFSSRTHLSSAQEVPSNASDGRAVARIAFSRDFSSAHVRVRFRKLEGDFTRMHLHCNVAGANGPVAVGLIDMVAPALDNSDNIFFDGDRLSGTLTNVDFPATDPCPGVIGRPVNNLVSLAAAIDAGLIYWNIHTTAFPPGELRGQVRPLDSDDD